MNERVIHERIESELMQEAALDRIISAHGERIRKEIDEYKYWLATDLRRARKQIAMLTDERETLIKRVLKLKKILARITEDLKGGGE